MTDDKNFPLLQNWKVTVSPFHGFDCVCGIIYHDTKGRFSNGEFVYTSPIVHLDESASVLRTKNTTYSLGHKLEC
jgi:hypothetical protein